MRHHLWVVFAALFGPACQLGDAPDAAALADLDALAAVHAFPNRRVCARPTAPDEVTCFARIRIHGDSTSPINTPPEGLAPVDLVSAYNIPRGGTGVTIAVVDPFDDPHAEADLAKYRAQFGLPPCTTANHCFKKLNQRGLASPLPRADRNWASEIALDLEMVSAGCPDCNIMLVEADSSTATHLDEAVNKAAESGADAISISWGGDETPSSPRTARKYYRFTGVAVFAAAGDIGDVVQFPASAPRVIAVGATTLTRSSATRGWAEAAWAETGSGCSKYIPKPSWQKGRQTDTGETPACNNRSVADMAAVGDPNTGVAVYDSYGGTGWEVYGGTSVSAPLVAGIWTATGHARDSAALAYTYTNAFYDVTSGSNGVCTVPYLCNAGVGYDGPTGVGTPNGEALRATCFGSSCGGTCDTHVACSVGAELDASCNFCTAEICDADPFCCTTRWDETCVGEVQSVCGTSCDAGS